MAGFRAESDHVSATGGDRSLLFASSIVTAGFVDIDPHDRRGIRRARRVLTRESDFPPGWLAGGAMEICVETMGMKSY